MASIAGHAGGDISVSLDKQSLNKILKKLAKLDTKVARKAVREGVKAGASDIQGSMKDFSPRLLGVLKRNIAVKVRVNKRNKSLYALIGAKWLEQDKNPAVYIHILEHGGKYLRRGLNPFAEDAFKASVARASKSVISTLKTKFREGLGKL